RLQIVAGTRDFKHFGAAARRAAFDERAQYLCSDFLGPIRVVEFDQLFSDLLVVLIAETPDGRGPQFLIGIGARYVEQQRNRSRARARAEYRDGRRLKARTRGGIRFQSIGDDRDRAFFVSLIQTLQSEDLDLAVVLCFYFAG